VTEEIFGSVVVMIGIHDAQSAFALAIPLRALADRYKPELSRSTRRQEASSSTFRLVASRRRRPIPWSRGWTLPDSEVVYRYLCARGTTLN
jgi:hypothetical protein